MPTYKISSEVYLGCSYFGGASAKASADITFTPEQVATLLRILAEAYADGEDVRDISLDDTDLIDLDIDLYYLLHDAYFDCSYQPYYENWVNRAYDPLDPVGIVIDWNQVRRICTESYGYIPEEPAVRNADRFRDWFEKNIKSTGRLIDFERCENLLDFTKEEYEFPAPPQLPPALVADFLKAKQ